MITTIVTRLWCKKPFTRMHTVDLASDPGDARNLIVQPPCFITDAKNPESSNETDWRSGWPYRPDATTTHA